MSRLSLRCLLLFLVLFAPLFLAADEPTKVDRYGDPLPEEAVARLGTLRFWHGSTIYCLAYSPDGKLLASGGFDSKIVLWDAQSGRKVRELQSQRGRVTLLAFSPDSKLLVSAYDNQYQARRWIPDEDLIGDLYLWNVATAEVVFHLLDKKEPTWAVTFSPDGKTIASAHGYAGVRLWNAKTGKQTRVLVQGKSGTRASKVAFTPDGKSLATIGDGDTIWFSDLPSGKGYQPGVKPGRTLYTLAFAKDGAILAVAGEFGIRIYDAFSLKEMPRLEGQKGPVDSLAFCPNGKAIITRGADQVIRVWDLVVGKQRCQLPKQELDITTIAISPDGRTVASGYDSFAGVVHLWDAQTGIARPPGIHPGPVNQVRFLGAEKSGVSTGHYSQVVVWPGGTGKDARPVELPRDSASFWLCSNHTTLAVPTTDGKLVLLDLATNKALRCCPIGQKFTVLAVSADNQRAAVRFGPDNLQVWDLVARKEIHRFPTAARGVEFSPDGQRVAVTYEKYYVVWDLARKQEVCRVALADVRSYSLPSTLAFSPDGRTLAISTDDSTTSYVLLLEIATGQERLRLQGRTSTINSVTFSSEGRILASGNQDGTVRLWDVAKGKELHVFHGHSRNVNMVDFSSDGQWLVSGSDDTTALVWDIPPLCRERKPAAVKLDPGEGPQLWGMLAACDAVRGYAAVNRLVAAPADGVSLCRERLFETPKTTPEQIQNWIAQLDDEEFTVRELASNNLERVEAEAETALEKALKGDCSPEVQRRIKALLETLKGKEFSIRVLRAVELLEQIGTPKAVDVLRQLEKKTSDPAVRDDVRRSLGRLEAKRKTP